MTACPRRTEWFQRPDPDVVHQDMVNGRCNYCGSISQEKFLELAATGAELGPTDKNYKVYVPGGKFYFQHLDEAGKERFITLFNERKLVLGYPHHFYTVPFFMRFEPL